MADITSGITVKEVASPYQGKCIIVTTAATADDGDTFTLTLATYGITTMLGVHGWIHTTTDSVLVAEDPTTSVTTGVATLTVGGATDDKKRTYIVWGI